VVAQIVYWLANLRFEESCGNVVGSNVGSVHRNGIVRPSRGADAQRQNRGFELLEAAKHPAAAGEIDIGGERDAFPVARQLKTKKVQSLWGTAPIAL
jgi:hypothetical protein